MKVVVYLHFNWKQVGDFAFNFNSRLNNDYPVRFPLFENKLRNNDATEAFCLAPIVPTNTQRITRENNLKPKLKTSTQA